MAKRVISQKTFAKNVRQNYHWPRCLWKNVRSLKRLSDMKAREIRKMRAEKRNCPYCGNKFYSGCMCGACYGKRDRIHDLWVLCQEIKKLCKSEVQTDDR